MSHCERCSPIEAYEALCDGKGPGELVAVPPDVALAVIGCSYGASVGLGRGGHYRSGLYHLHARPDGVYELHRDEHPVYSAWHVLDLVHGLFGVRLW